jgi:KUP system potassium uptake protein
VEGLKIASPAFSDYVVPLTVIILIALFAAQSRGTARVAAMFGPVMVVWFVSIAVAGGLHIRDDPTVLFAINPFYGVDFLIHHGTIGLVTLGAVFLVVTGGEALYADLGHFGRKPIQTAWLGLVLPALLINYFGQGAKVLADPSAIENPFYKLVPETLLLPMVVLATAATVIASQAVITGAYSLVHQAIQLGLLHPSRDRLTDDRRATAGWAIPQFQRTGLGIWYCGCDDDDRGWVTCLCRDLERVAVAAVEDAAVDFAVCHC